MKAIMTRVASRPIMDCQSVTSYSQFWFRQWALEQGLVHEMHVHTSKIREAKQLAFCVDADDFNEYDCVFVHTSPQNFFGGRASSWTINTAKMLAEYEGPVVYVCTDPRIPAINWCDAIRRVEPYLMPQEYVEFEDLIWEEGRGTCMYTGTDYLGWRDTRQQSYFQAQLPRFPSHVEEFKDFIRYMALRMIRPLPIVYPSTCVFDLCYYGDPRGGDRMRKVKLFDPDLVIGNWPHRVCQPKVPHNELAAEVRKAKASLIIGDDIQDNDWPTMRVYEAPLWGVLSLVDVRNDPEGKYYDEWVRQHCYVTDDADAQSKLEYIMRKPGLYEELVTKQRERWGIGCQNNTTT